MKKSKNFNIIQTEELEPNLKLNIISFLSDKDLNKIVQISKKRMLSKEDLQYEWSVRLLKLLQKQFDNDVAEQIFDTICSNYKDLKYNKKYFELLKSIKIIESLSDDILDVFSKEFLINETKGKSLDIKNRVGGGTGYIDYIKNRDFDNCSLKVGIESRTGRPYIAMKLQLLYKDNEERFGLCNTKLVIFKRYLSGNFYTFACDGERYNFLSSRGKSFRVNKGAFALLQNSYIKDKKIKETLFSFFDETKRKPVLNAKAEKLCLEYVGENKEKKELLSFFKEFKNKPLLGSKEKNLCMEYARNLVGEDEDYCGVMIKMCKQ